MAAKGITPTPFSASTADAKPAWSLLPRSQRNMFSFLRPSAMTAGLKSRLPPHSQPTRTHNTPFILLLLRVLQAQSRVLRGHSSFHSALDLCPTETRPPPRPGPLQTYLSQPGLHNSLIYLRADIFQRMKFLVPKSWQLYSWVYIIEKFSFMRPEQKRQPRSSQLCS